MGRWVGGGGLRGRVFHLGALRRLNELGVLSRSDFRTVASVSGGSIMSPQLADAFTHLVLAAGQAIPRDVWGREVQAPLRAFTPKDVRTAPFPPGLPPWNGGRSRPPSSAL